MTLPRTWRLLVDGAADGCWNMAVDEALLDGQLQDSAKTAPVLRLYGWRPAALSLGRSQPPRFDADYLERERMEWVRRPTGGLSVLHDHERTYAIAGRLRSADFPGSVVDTYDRIAAALHAGLAGLGVACDRARPGSDAPAPTGSVTACFHGPSLHELTVDGRKLLGSAQLRRRGAFLQQGSLPIALDAERTHRALGTRTPLLATDLTTCLGSEPAVADIDRALIDGIAEAFRVSVEPGGLTAWEHERAVQLYGWKYSSLAWGLGGRYGEREERWGPAALASRSSQR